MDHKLDFAREERTGVAEAILGSGKSAEQIASIVETVLSAEARMLITRLDPEKARALGRFGEQVRYDALSGTAEVGVPRIVSSVPAVAVVAAGTSDMSVAQQALRTLAFFGESATLFADIGVAGLWRLTERLEEIRQFPVVIAVAGMEGAIFSVLAGLVRAPVIAVPTSVGYGVSEGGHAALSSALASCAPGVLVVNIDNGFGAAAAALKILNVGRG
ncbi:nickel pincer cofactor biosynthesis protein LarB [Roseicitreum antarcticum]|uniref:nickel pincer cofactor biosynthesis protein LarB n=1 Tax=Roseicitreum antarcticum TaxID=564137 RepID=UPI000B8A426A|nr:nickel pincer cofactor biosynthesis protein LarB [Roseicitreum antarcticum]